METEKDALIDDYFGDDTEKFVETPFAADTESKVNWVMGKLAALDAEESRWEANKAKRFAEIESDRKALLARFQADIENWARGEREARGRQSVTLPNGTLTFRKSAERWAVADKETAIQTARIVCPGAVSEETKVVVSLDSKKLIEQAKEARIATGEILPGLEVIPPGESFKIVTSAKGEV